MGLEIEHKYLVTGDGYRSMAVSADNISQGYLCRDPERTVRVRIRGNRGYLTVKGCNHGAVRLEFEYEIPVGDARQMLKLCQPPVLEKTRYTVPFKGHDWEVDCFHGIHEGLVTAEIELSSPDEPYCLPPFAGENITGNPRYYNSNLQQ